MNVQQLIDTIDPQAYERLKYAVETGRWPDGTQISQEQRDLCMQAVMLYQSKYNTNPQHMSVAAGGEISLKSKAEFKREFVQGDEDIVRVKLEDGQ